VIDNLNGLDDFAGIGVGPFRGRGNQKLASGASAEFLQCATKRLIELQLTLRCHRPSPLKALVP
jgi:hypothetical protein